MATRPNPTSPVVRAGVYTRISWDPGGQRAGVERQRVDCEATCAARSWEVAEYFEDNDRSAYTGKRRPAYERMLAAVEDRRLDAVVTWHNDRLHRSPRELEAFIDLVERSGERVAVVSGGDYDLTTPEGRFTARIVGAVARKSPRTAAAGSGASTSSWPSRGDRRAISAGVCAARPSVSSSGRQRVACLPAKASSPSLGTGTVAGSRGRQPLRGPDRRCGRSSSRRGSPDCASTAPTHGDESWAR